MLALGFQTQAAVLAIVAVVVTGCIAAGLDVAGALDRAIVVVARWLTAAAGGVAFAVIVIPGWIWTRVLRRDALRPRRNAVGWAATSAITSAPSALGSTAAGTAPTRSLTRRLVWAVECVLLVGVANYGVGWAWDRATGRIGPDSFSSAVGKPNADTVFDPRVNAKAMAAYPWRKQYFADLQRPTIGYWPFTEMRPEPYSSRYINIDGWTRKSYEAPGSASGRPTLWMFGGSTTFGEGQRDEFTIASYLARIAEDEGIPITVSNFGQRGWTHFQEMVLYAQRLELEDPPDLSVFYDGVNEISAQSLLNEAAPSNTVALDFAERLRGAHIATRFAQEPVADDLSTQLWHAYTLHSFAHKLVYALRPSPADAQPAQQTAQQTPTGDDPINTDATEPDASFGTNYKLTPQDGTDAGRVYEQGKRLTQSLSESHGVDDLFFWQPVGLELEPQKRARAELSSSTIDISRALLDHPEVFIDGGHTNEVGARIVAEAIWEHLEPAVRRWYATHD